jgi:hypothetical protein
VPVLVDDESLRDGVADRLAPHRQPVDEELDAEVESPLRGARLHDEPSAVGEHDGPDRVGARQVLHAHEGTGHRIEEAEVGQGPDRRVAPSDIHR